MSGIIFQKSNERTKQYEVSYKHNYIKDDRLTTLARAATWLGNDETHYVRQHPDYTLKELKAFADAFITFIDADLAYEAALKLVTP